MTKSIEEQEHIKNLVESEIFLIKDGLFPDERVRSSTFDDIGRRLKSMYNEGVKARDAEWLKVVNELESLMYTNPNVRQDAYNQGVRDCINRLTKADQLLKDMGMKL